MTSEVPDNDRFIVVNGRRWRRTDPAIPDSLRTELVRELMRARRAVKDANTADDLRRARSQVDDAKRALGERGDPWWDRPTDEGLRRRASSAARALLRARDASSSLCPSEIARVVGGIDWRETMPAVRDAVGGEAADGQLRITQGSQTIAEHDARGPVRVRRGPLFDKGERTA